MPVTEQRAGGVYIPPAKLRAMQAQLSDKNSVEYQRMAWEALKKSINGLINKVNVSNIKYIVPELFGENLIRGKGLFCRSIMKAQAASVVFTPIYAGLVAIVNTKLPEVGELLVHRLVSQFRKGFKRNDKSVCLSSSTFLAHLVNQQVVHEILAAEILMLLLQKPTDDSVEIAVGLAREVGHHLEEMNSQIALIVYDRFRNILHEADIEKRTQYMIEVLFQVRKDRYKDNPAVREELDLVEEDDQITHSVSLDEPNLETKDMLNVFKADPNYEANEEEYQKLKAVILGEGSDDEEDEEGSEVSSEDEEEAAKDREMEIKDQTNADLINLRRKIYLTMKSSGGFEECCHKLMRIDLPAGMEEELPSMIIECASQERTYDKFYGLIGERFCKLNRLWMDLFENQFVKYYDTIHRYESGRLRIVAQFFAYLLASDAIGWHVLSIIHLNQEETTASSRIFIKILFEDLVLGMGVNKLSERLKDETLQESLAGIFPKDNPTDTRFAVNYFTAIGMGKITEPLRDHLKAVNLAQQQALATKARSPSVSSESDRSFRSPSRTPPRRGRGRSPSSEPGRGRTRSRTYSDSRSPSRSISRSQTPPRRRRRYTPSISRSRSRSRSPSASRSRSPPRRHRRSPSYYTDDSRSRTPPRRRTARRYTSSPSRSPSPAPRRRARSPSSSPNGGSRRRASSLARRGRRAYSSSRSRSPPKRVGRRNTSSPEGDGRRPSRGRTGSLSPPPRRGRGRSDSGGSRGRPPPPPPRDRRR
ncbi:MIF4G-domain-containing protein [Eremomyces bilateralis CBS 781.70]|uniref:Pre-mRNA-splicing factor CWC22 n=1 Tax=Eremomyces bilateralis CBS 781.70 TaxID=1392243 RepID=A0A6G1GCF4_9PEZI|nr:MIF4G-domain-containing protein [Eremomyces bilateralis CBS 781.70]KAF1815778.1 MIF4G-domain-containing protein [Eremomyces bilateralis CBS 781.70]